MFTGPATLRPVRRRGVLLAAALPVILAATLTVVPSTTATAAAADPTVITDWNATAVATIAVDAGKANAEAFMWFAYEQAAVYNAVVGITLGAFLLYVFRSRPTHAI